MDIRTENLGRRFSGATALDDVNATFRAGRVTAVLGANGAGKSTLLSLLAGHLVATHGKVTIDGRPMRPTAVSLRRKVMLLDDTSHKNCVLSPSQFVARWLEDYRATGDGIEQTVVSWIHRMGLIDAWPKQMSGLSKGQAYKIHLAALLTIAPLVWLLDEPMSAGLDASGMQLLESELRRHADQSGTVVFTSQWPQHARRLADDVIVLHQGKCVWQGDVHRVPDKIKAEDDNASLAAVMDGLRQSPIDRASHGSMIYEIAIHAFENSAIAKTISGTSISRRLGNVWYGRYRFAQQRRIVSVGRRTLEGRQIAF